MTQAERIITRQSAPIMPQAASWLVNELMNNQELLGLASSWAYLELEDQGFDPDLIRQLKDAEQHEQLEDAPVYNAYYRAQTVWFRKLLTASAGLL